ncbi:MAG TPA: phospholipase [Candidatus Latescibacteria bacterium]|nr:phospholipase [Candidatus Handelsmanbacteria bacterium]HIL10616.1 phospholipase [Candidatus Latescibacterota bacterium]
MSESSLHYIVHNAPDTSAHDAPLLLLLHGYGSNEEDLIGLAPHLDTRLFCVSARAPYEMDFGGFAWFNIEMGSGVVRIDFAQAMQSLVQIYALVDALVEEYRSTSVYIAGFSQGASMALSAALKKSQAFAGAISLSGFCGPEMMPEDPASVRGLPVFMSHGRQDTVIPIAQARASKEMLDPLALDLLYSEYDMPHAIDQPCLVDLAAWLEACLDVEQ